MIVTVLCCCERRVSWDYFGADVVYLDCQRTQLCSVDGALLFCMHCAAPMALIRSKNIPCATA